MRSIDLLIVHKSALCTLECYMLQKKVLRIQKKLQKRFIYTITSIDLQILHKSALCSLEWSLFFRNATGTFFYYRDH